MFNDHLTISYEMKKVLDVEPAEGGAITTGLPVKRWLSVLRSFGTECFQGIYMRIVLTLHERLCVDEGLALDVVVVVALLYFGRYMIPVVGQLDFDPSMPSCQKSTDKK